MRFILLTRLVTAWKCWCHGISGRLSSGEPTEHYPKALGMIFRANDFRILFLPGREPSQESPQGFVGGLGPVPTHRRALK